MAITTEVEGLPMVATPLRVGDYELKNRLVMAPMATRTADEAGHVTRDTLCYYRRRAKGGPALIVVEHAYVLPQGRLDQKQLCACDDSCTEGLAKLARVIHEGGSRALLQLSHAGAASVPADPGLPVLAPSAVLPPGRRRHGNNDVLPLSMTKGQLNQVFAAFYEGARRALRAGFDGVQVHAAHGYLLSQFFSPLTNVRTDEYGCASLENRIRATVEAVRAAKSALDETFIGMPDAHSDGRHPILSVRIGGSDYLEGGATLDDGASLARALQAEGVDLLDVSGGIRNFSRHACNPPGFFRDASALAREAAGIPVVTAGGVRTPREAEWLLQIGACDLVGLGRAMMRNPSWPRMALEELWRAE